MVRDELPETAEPDANEALLDRLERLVVRFLSMRHASEDVLWRLERDLLTLQRDVQSAISVSKRHRTTEGRQQTKALRETLWHARRLGDTMAWDLFGGDRRRMFALSENERAPVSPEGRGLEGLISAAQHSSRDMGFPLLHDITDLLRIGDITFFRPGQKPRTVEVKTKLVSSVTAGRSAGPTYEVTTISAAAGPPPPGAVPTGRPPVSSDTRMGRQLARMIRANALQEAVPGSTVTEGRPTRIIETVGTAESHWPLIRRLIRQAKRRGYASGAADRTTLYTVFYNADGDLSGEDPLPRYDADVRASGVLFADDPDDARNRILLAALPNPWAVGPQRYMPHFLYPIPMRWKVDILRGRLSIMATLNVGRLAEALEDAGFTTSEGDGYLFMFAEVETDRGRVVVAAPSLDDIITDMVMEALSLEHIVLTAQSVTDAYCELVAAMFSDEEAESS